MGKREERLSEIKLELPTGFAEIIFITQQRLIQAENHNLLMRVCQIRWILLKPKVTILHLWYASIAQTSFLRLGVLVRNLVWVGLPIFTWEIPENLGATSGKYEV